MQIVRCIYLDASRAQYMDLTVHDLNFQFEFDNKFKLANVTDLKRNVKKHFRISIRLTRKIIINVTSAQ